MLVDMYIYIFIYLPIFFIYLHPSFVDIQSYLWILWCSSVFGYQIFHQISRQFVSAATNISQSIPWKKTRFVQNFGRSVSHVSDPKKIPETPDHHLARKMAIPIPIVRLRFHGIPASRSMRYLPADGSEIRRSPVEVGSLSHDLPGFSTIPGGVHLPGAGFLNHQQHV